MIKNTKTPTYLRRYTDLPSLLHILRTKSLTLLDPATWDDKNDSFFMSLFKKEKNLKSLLALCFTQAPETYHHWRVFSNGPSGVCLVFNQSTLLEDFDLNPEISCGPMEYLTLANARKRGKIQCDELPFVKRYGYKPEHEFRTIYGSKTEQISSLPIPIRLSSIRSISLSPWMHPTLRDSTVKAIRENQGCEKLKISRSTLISNDEWKRLGAGGK